MKSLELFSGAGGLALGLDQAGFRHVAMVERDKHSCRNILLNKEKSISPFSRWNLLEEDVRNINYRQHFSSIDAVAGGPPCQPFSLGGKHRAYNDSRDMFPEAVRAVRELVPKVFVFENVRGLVRKSFSTYFEYILLQLTYPEIVRSHSLSWEDHLRLLERHHVSNKGNGGAYRVLFRVLNAADYGVPQIRHRVFIVGFRSDLQIEWSFPEPTHSFESLFWAQWVTGEYWDAYKVPKRERPELQSNIRDKINRLKNSFSLTGPVLKRWRTVRDAIHDLQDKMDIHVTNHEYRLGAKSYSGHTGSSLDEAGKTLKAGDHGVPGGENMVRFYDGTVRYFTVREGARLQTFPDDYQFFGSWTENMRQIGNAVPVKLAEVIGKSIFSVLEGRNG